MYIIKISKQDTFLFVALLLNASHSASSVFASYTRTLFLQKF